MSRVESEHPTAEDDLEQLNRDAENLQKEQERLQRGELALPWPHSTRAIGAMGIIAFITAGALAFGSFGEVGFLGGVVAGGAGLVLMHQARWMHRHFETGPAPRYPTTATDGGEE